jgi:hypothetical protein
MSMPTIETRRNTASETRYSPRRFGLDVFECGKPGNRPARSLTGYGSGVSRLPDYFDKALPGFHALIASRTHDPSDAIERAAVGKELTFWVAQLSASIAELTATQRCDRTVDDWHWLSSGQTFHQASQAEGEMDETLAVSEQEHEMVDWDVCIETLPPRPSRQVVLGFEPGSYRPPRIVIDPED